MSEYTIKIERDEDPFDPRTSYDNLGTMACFHKNYKLGDAHVILSVEETKEIYESDEYFSLPLYLYDHGGISMDTNEFFCPWDSGQVGIIFVSKEDVCKEWSVDTVSKELEKLIIENLQGEVRTYNRYITGEVYGYIIEKDEIYTSESGKTVNIPEQVESCWGFYCKDECEKEALAIVQDLKKV